MFGLIVESGAAGWVILAMFIAGVAAVTTVGRSSGRPGATAAAWAVAILAIGSLGYGVGQRRVNSSVNRAAHAPPTAEQGRAPLSPPPRRWRRSRNAWPSSARGHRRPAANQVLAKIAASLVSALGGALVFFRRGKAGVVEPAPPAPTAHPVRG